MPLDSYQDEDLAVLRERWSDALFRRRQHLHAQLQVNKLRNVHFMFLINFENFIGMIVAHLAVVVLNLQSCNILQKLVNMSPSMKSERDNEREQSLVEQWVSLTEERNAVSYLIYVYYNIYANYTFY